MGLCLAIATMNSRIMFDVARTHLLLLAAVDVLLHAGAEVVVVALVHRENLTVRRSVFMSGWLRQNVPMLGSRVKSFTPWPVVYTSMVLLP